MSSSALSHNHSIGDSKRVDKHRVEDAGKSEDLQAVHVGGSSPSHKGSHQDPAQSSQLSACQSPEGNPQPLPNQSPQQWQASQAQTWRVVAHMCCGLGRHAATGSTISQTHHYNPLQSRCHSAASNRCLKLSAYTVDQKYGAAPQSSHHRQGRGAYLPIPPLCKGQSYILGRERH